ncbi:NAD-dependent epimerase/dehydratase family protein [Kribbella sancticallisti]|uniref:NAD-dependent epimerase/dehydratase family protein n=1 Tax=Kribbella sancticallisti TaxID=460087 RepID=UPI003CD08FC4
MRVVITGASGNVGSALTRRLRAAGEYDIIAVARRVPDQAAMGRSRWVSIDLSSRDCENQLRQVVRGADAEVHLAWAFQPSHQVRYLEAVGVGGTQRVLDACTSTGVGQVVHTSSVGAYSPERDVLRETIEGMSHASAGSTAVLRRRTVTSKSSALLSRGPVSHRRQP